MGDGSSFAPRFGQSVGADNGHCCSARKVPTCTVSESARHPAIWAAGRSARQQITPPPRRQEAASNARGRGSTSCYGNSDKSWCGAALLRPRLHRSASGVLGVFRIRICATSNLHVQRMSRVHAQGSLRGISRSGVDPRPAVFP